MLYKKAVPNNFANFFRVYGYRSPFSSSCKPRACNFIEIDGPVQVFCCEFCEILRKFYAEQLSTTAPGREEALWEINVIEINNSS